MRRLRRIEIARAAEADLLEIGRHTETNWGTTQRKHYLSALAKGIKSLARNPQLGAPRDEVRAGLRFWPCGSHLIYYCFDDAAVSIIRILHHSMDTEEWLSG